MIRFHEICLPLTLLTAFLLFSMQVDELEKEIMDSREKIEFYRTKMQELVSLFVLKFTHRFVIDSTILLVGKLSYNLLFLWMHFMHMTTRYF